jgi:uncharacterized Zn finger protein
MARKGRYGTGNFIPDYDWRDFGPSSPREVEGGLALASRRGAIGRTWWSKRWIEVLESFGWASRLQRGRNYARKGQVTDLRVTAKGVEALVQGSRPEPYKVSIHLKPTDSVAWGRVAVALREDAGLLARLLAGEVPEDLEKVFTKAGTALLPRKAPELRTDCSCPDTANPCKHIAAVHYILAERLDQDPFLVFLLRGKNREEVLKAVTSREAPSIPQAAPQAVIGAEADADEPDLLAYWRPGPRLAQADCVPHPPAVDGVILKRIGDPVFLPAAQASVLRGALGKVYATITDRALAASRGERPSALLPIASPAMLPKAGAPKPAHGRMRIEEPPPIATRRKKAIRIIAHLGIRARRPARAGRKGVRRTVAGAARPKPSGERGPRGRPPSKGSRRAGRRSRRSR